MNRPPWTIGQAFRRLALPLASYYTVTLVVPLANGAAAADAFLKHALLVLVVPPALVTLACGACRLAHAVFRLRSTQFFNSRAHHVIVGLLVRLCG